MFEWHGTVPYRNWAYSREKLDEMLSKGNILLREDGTVSASRGHKIYLDEQPGMKLQSIWDDVAKVGTSSERTGYKTKKPVPLYERMVKASSNEGDIVLDPFCGCGTTIEAGIRNGRNVIGIDILPFAVNLVNDCLNERLGITLPLEGVPVCMETATRLSNDDSLKFQDWAISIVPGLASNPKKVGDDGIDGFGMLHRKPDNMDKRAILVQVTGASGSQKMKFDKLQSDVRSYHGAMGLLITKDKQNAFPSWTVNLDPIEMGITRYPPMQCLSIEEYFQNGNAYEPPLNLPALSNPWTGEAMLQERISF